jgi:hypothetical protein
MGNVSCWKAIYTLITKPPSIDVPRGTLCYSPFILIISIDIAHSSFVSSIIPVNFHLNFDCFDLQIQSLKKSVERKS